MKPSDLPIHDAIPALLAALRGSKRAVLQAPPGAGKTTVVPLEMLAAGLTDGKILMLEPRRLATRAAAERMASTLGEPVGQTVGYRIKGESQTSKHTRIEVVTEGILTRMIQSDPTLEGIGAVFFDEFHERSLNADLGLALCWEIRAALRDDLIVLVMSATLDAAPVAEMLDNAPIITSDGRAFPVETIWLDRPVAKTTRLERAACDLILSAADKTTGGILVFLPGEGEIRRVEAILRANPPPDTTIHPLFGAMSFAAQRAAIAPAKSGRKIVLATSIAETSLTIEDIRVVVDCGLSRRARFDSGSGMSRLVTERTTRAEAEQRRGRAGRVAHGHCYRMWTKGEEGGMKVFAPAEIETADLTGLALELATWGTRNTADLSFLTQPNPGALATARDLLTQLGAIDGVGAITQHGRQLAAIPLHPRLAHVLFTCGKPAAMFVALLSNRDPLRGETSNLLLRKTALEERSGQSNPMIHAIRNECKNILRLAPNAKTEYKWAELAALAYPDRIGLRRSGDAARWILSGGKGAKMDAHDPLASARLIVATDLDGDSQEAQIRTAIEITEPELRSLYDAQIEWRDICEWSRRERRVVARQQERFGALVLADRVWNDATAEIVAAAALDGIRDLGLPMNPAARRFQSRVELVRAGDTSMPDMSDTGLLDTLDDWLLPHVENIRNESDIKRMDILSPMRNALTWDQTQRLDQLAPSHFTTPLGRKVPIDYGGEAPEIAVRLQEMFGVTVHPVVGANRIPVRVTLLSPGQKAVQTTTDIPGFWATSYQDVRKDMRGRYPKHPWPEDPTIAEPTLRAKPRYR